MNKNLHYILIALSLICGLISCGKGKLTLPSSSSLTIVNAIPGSASLNPNFNSNTILQYYKTAQNIAVNSFTEFPGYTGDIPLSLSQSTDTLHTVFNSTIHIEPNSIHTLFVTGTLTTPDYLFTTDTIAALTDSVLNVRFVNISTGSNPVSVNIQGSPTTPIANIAYKGLSRFQTFVAKKATPAGGSYIFEFRDAATTTLLATYTLSPLIATKLYLTKSVTVAFKGVPGGTGINAQGAILVNNY